MKYQVILLVLLASVVTTETTKGKKDFLSVKSDPVTSGPEPTAPPAIDPESTVPPTAGPESTAPPAIDPESTVPPTSGPEPTAPPAIDPESTVPPVLTT